jgi:hypothetical protein
MTAHLSIGVAPRPLQSHDSAIAPAQALIRRAIRSQLSASTRLEVYGVIDACRNRTWSHPDALRAWQRSRLVASR